MSTHRFKPKRNETRFKPHVIETIGEYSIEKHPALFSGVLFKVTKNFRYDYRESIFVGTQKQAHKAIKDDYKTVNQTTVSHARLA